MDQLATPEQIAAIRRAAIDRAGFMRWLAEKLLATDDMLIRKEASKMLRQLAATE